MLLLSPATLLERRPLIYFCPLRLIPFFFSLSLRQILIMLVAAGAIAFRFFFFFLQCVCMCVRATTKDIITDVAEPKQNQ